MIKKNPHSDELTVRSWTRVQLSERYGRALQRLILAGSRAKGTHRANSDWDIIAVINGQKSIWPVGPIRHNAKLVAPDGNSVEVFELNPDDLKSPLASQNDLIREAIKYGTDL